MNHNKYFPNKPDKTQKKNFISKKVPKGLEGNWTSSYNFTLVTDITTD